MSERGRWRYDADTDSFIRTADGADLALEREQRDAATDRELQAAREEYRRDRDASRRAHAARG